MSSAPSIPLILLIAMAPLLAAAIGCAWLMKRQRPYPSCGRCGYDVSGSVGSAQCPECGTPYAIGGIVPAGRVGPRDRRRLVGTALVAAVIGTCLGSGFLAARIAAEREQVLRAVAARSRVRAETVEADLLQHMNGLAAEARVAADERRAARLAALGIAIAADTPGGDAGAGIESITAGSAADRAGLRAGDLVIGWNEKDVDGRATLERLVDEHEGFSPVALVIVRDGRPSTLTIDPENGT